MDSDRVDLLNQSINILERYAKCVIRDSKQDPSEEVAKLADHVKFYCESEEKHNAQAKAFEETLKCLNDDITSADALQLFENKIKQNEKMIGDVSYNSKYINFMNLFSGDSSEIYTVSETVQTIDPISKQRMVDPVKNKKCGHSYERSSILGLIKKNAHTRCPIVGCVAKTYVNKVDLVPDVELKRYLESPASQEVEENEKSHVLVDD